MNNDNELKNYCREYLEYSAILNYLRQQDTPDISSMHKIIKKMKSLEQSMFDYINKKNREALVKCRNK